eukprot:TRINITY_DN11087_c0_g2_i7.p1 TRINITY_DN11087_c0_g2~~TRINITY_DN11087_c0_g2_i7.p1  ORF type:complete len:355 (-),score=39.62 TRINITY_DN11087_c0_g2_i7:449-1513(-)
MGISDRRSDDRQVLLQRNKLGFEFAQIKQKKENKVVKLPRRALVGSKRARDTIKATIEAEQKRIKQSLSQATKDSCLNSHMSVSTARCYFGEWSQESSPQRTSRPQCSQPFNTDLRESMDYLRQLQQQETESTHAVNKNYFQEVQQDEITPDLRLLVTRLIGHIVEEEDLQEQTFHLAIRYMDRFLSKQRIEKMRLVLIAIVCLLLAAKFEEREPPSAKHLLKYTREAYDINQMLDVEREVINELRTLLTPTACAAFGTFQPLLGEMFLNQQELKQVVQKSQNIINNAGLLNSGLLRFAPSDVAAGAVAVGMVQSNFSHYRWYQMLKLNTSFDVDTVNKCREVIQAGLSDLQGE